MERRTRLRFGEWMFDAGARLVLDSAGTPVHLTPKAFDLLAILIERAPNVVRKADLHARLWPDCFVSDVTLAGMVKELRRAFRDKAGPCIPDVARCRLRIRCGIEPSGTGRARSLADHPGPSSSPEPGPERDRSRSRLRYLSR